MKNSTLWFALLVTLLLTLAMIPELGEAAAGCVVATGLPCGFEKTAAARARTAAGECVDLGLVCYEFCDESGPTGEFDCGYEFPDDPTLNP